MLQFSMPSTLCFRLLLIFLVIQTTLAWSGGNKGVYDTSESGITKQSGSEPINLLEHVRAVGNRVLPNDFVTLDNIQELEGVERPHTFRVDRVLPNYQHADICVNEGIISIYLRSSDYLYFSSENNLLLLPSDEEYVATFTLSSQQNEVDHLGYQLTSLQIADRYYELPPLHVLYQRNSDESASGQDDESKAEPEGDNTPISRSVGITINQGNSSNFHTTSGYEESVSEPLPSDSNNWWVNTWER